MRFNQLDRITELHPGETITAIRELRADEHYLEDHFPRFPVMPGVLMLEAMYQASAWLIRKSEGFSHAAVLLKEARNVRFQGFVAPGQTLTVKATIIKQDEQTTTLKVDGSVDGNPAASGRLVLERFHLADRFPGEEPIDAHANNEMYDVFTSLYQE